MMTAALSHRGAALDKRQCGSFDPAQITLPCSAKAVPTARSGLTHTGSLGMPKSEGREMTPNVDAGGPGPETYSCPHCNKRFSRLCDLNKHANYHSRPYKCAFQDCKYLTLGWPTAKELERHVNDKHSSHPRTYPCRFPHCSYESKRESNCKQHMEKTHGWRYVRSKSNTGTASKRARSQLPAPHVFPATRSSSPQSLSPRSNTSKPSTYHARNDFVLFPEGYDRVPSDHGHVDIGHLDLDDRDSQASDVVIPWTSPDTRLRRRETFLQTFTQKFDRPEDELPIDPQLSAVGGVDAKSSIAQISLNSSHGTDRDATSRNLSVTEEHTMSATEQALPSAASTLALQQRPAGSMVPSNHGRSPSANAMQSPATGSMPSPICQVPRASKRKADDDPEDGNPQKNFKSAPRVDFQENQMPDIFMAAYPEVYNRVSKCLYHSCETKHKNISTLMRHLSRAPHRLSKSERYLHSFDVEPGELSHVKRGVCLRCWVVFTSRESLDNHLSSGCEKVSKGKKEKWQILFDAFTPLATEAMSTGHTQSTVNFTQPASQSSGTVINQSLYGCAASVHGADYSRAPPPSPTTVRTGPRVPRERGDGGEVEHLRRKVRHLEAVVLNQAVALSRLARPNLLEAINGGNDLTSGSAMRSVGRLALPAYGFAEHVSSDAATLVSQMNSQPTDVDRQGMMDDIQQTFSRTSSSTSSSDKSAVRHVSNSPPQRYEAYNGANASVPRARPVNSRGLTSPQHQPPSLPDSGYGSDKKRNSISGPVLAEQSEQPKQPNAQPDRATTPVLDDQTARAEIGLPIGQDGVGEPRPRLGSPECLPLDLDMWADPCVPREEADAAYHLSTDFWDQLGVSQPSSSSLSS